jgi:hypothetical protein
MVFGQQVDLKCDLPTDSGTSACKSHLVGRRWCFGSANLTHRAWFSNIEAGVFLDQQDIEDNELAFELEAYFSEVHVRSSELTNEVYLEQLALWKKRSDDFDAAEKKNAEGFEKSRLIPRLPSLTGGASKSAESLLFRRFDKEWNDTLQIMRSIGERFAKEDSRPIWIDKTVPPAVQVDQFLHGFYYQKVREGAGFPVQKFHEANRKNVQAALNEAVGWWVQSDASSFQEEARNMHVWAPRIRELAAEDRLLHLSASEFVDLISKVHAVRDHVYRSGSLNFAGVDATGWELEKKLEAFGLWLYATPAADGASILELLHRLIWDRKGYPPESITKRLWRAASKECSAEHLKLSSLGEILGWARPDLYPPRNNRTSKSLKALGYDVAVS